MVGPDQNALVSKERETSGTTPWFLIFLVLNGLSSSFTFYWLEKSVLVKCGYWRRYDHSFSKPAQVFPGTTDKCRSSRPSSRKLLFTTDTEPQKSTGNPSAVLCSPDSHTQGSVNTGEERGQEGSTSQRIRTRTAMNLPKWAVLTREEHANCPVPQSAQKTYTEVALY